MFCYILFVILILCFNYNLNTVNANCREWNAWLTCNSNPSLIEINNFTSQDKIKDLDIYGLNETKLSTESFQFPDLEKLKIYDTNIQQIEAEAFANLDYLTVLTLRNNKFYFEIKPDTFYGLVQLTELTITKSPIEIIKNDTFQGLSNLKILNLFENSLRTIEPNAFSSLYKLKELRLNNNQIQQIPKTLLKNLFNLVQLDLQNNDIEKLQRDHFIQIIAVNIDRYTQYAKESSPIQNFNLAGNQNFQLESNNFNYDSMIKLDLSKTGLETILPGAFSPTLKELILDSNKLTKLTNGVFDTLVNLTDLSIEKNMIRSFDEDCFNNMVELRYLYLSYNYITELSKQLFKNLVKLENLGLSENRINLLKSDDFEYLRNLRFLDLRYNHINYLLQGTFKNLKYLTVLYISANDIISIQSKTFASLFNLNKLDLSENKLQTIDEGVFDGRNKDNYSKLTSVKITFNPLTRLGKDVFLPLIQVQELNLDSNEIQQIESGIFRTMNMLKSLSIRNNSLKILPNGLFTNLPNLQTVYLDSNKITEIQSDAFRRINMLKLLSFKNNLLETLPDGLFTNIPNLQELILTENKFQTLSDSMFSNLRSLKSIDLSHNYLKYVNPLALKGSEIERLSILKNNVTFVEDEFFANSPQLKYFTYDQNPLQCKCYFQMMKTMEKFNITQDVQQTLFHSALGEIPVCTVTSFDTCVKDPNLNLNISNFFFHIIEMTLLISCFNGAIAVKCNLS